MTTKGFESPNKLLSLLQKRKELWAGRVNEEEGREWARSMFSALSLSFSSSVLLT
jgi:hypothetical protein